MKDKDFEELETFIRRNKALFYEVDLKQTEQRTRKKSLLDDIIRKMYFRRRKNGLH